jgi:hypothetical protein
VEKQCRPINARLVLCGSTAASARLVVRFNPVFGELVVSNDSDFDIVMSTTDATFGRRPHLTIPDPASPTCFCSALKPCAVLLNSESYNTLPKGPALPDRPSFLDHPRIPSVAPRTDMAMSTRGRLPWAVKYGCIRARPFELSRSEA